MGSPGCSEAGGRLVLRQPLAQRPWVSISDTARRRTRLSSQRKPHRTRVQHSWSSCPLSQGSCREPVLKVTVGGHIHPCPRSHRESLPWAGKEPPPSFTAFQRTKSFQLPIFLKIITGLTRRTVLNGPGNNGTVPCQMVSTVSLLTP